MFKPVLQHTGPAQNVNRPGALSLQQPGTCIGGGAGCVNIIYKQNVLAPDVSHAPLRAKRKYAAHLPRAPP